MHPHYLTSYIFWKKWFRDHPQNPNFGGYIFPQPIEQFREKVWKGRSVCPICNDFKSVQVGEDGVLIEPTEVYCICTVLEFIMDRWKGNKLFESTWKRDANIDELKPFGDKQAINDLKEFKVYIKQWVNNPTRWVWVQSSNTGTGKTKTMHWIRATLGSMVTYVSVEQMAAQMFNLLNTNKDKLEEMKKHLRDAPILILDDVGYEHNVGWTKKFFGEMINGRYLANSKITPSIVVATSNLDLADLAASSDLDIRRPASRFADKQMCDQFILSQEDFRVKA